VDATVTVTATGPAGESVGPIDVPNRDSAVYATTFEVPSPGTWSLAFSSTEPAAEVSTQVEVLGPEATTTAAPSTAAPTTAGPTTSLAPTSEAAPTTAAGAATTDDEDDGDSNLLAVVAIGVVLAAIVAAVALAARRRATPDPDAPSPAG